ncbi:endonuclease V isoform X1 [Senna tora]|uniref:Endonuclease V isoform X1 n=1 Tax=Senna tora TaxID=362788 RepID=A0A834TGY7_9FABA|nr:endonuclease V isoform X1 [Senna tora]
MEASPPLPDEPQNQLSALVVEFRNFTINTMKSMKILICTDVKYCKEKYYRIKESAVETNYVVLLGFYQMGLINPDASLARLHVVLLKGCLWPMKLSIEVAIGKKIKSDAIPILEKLYMVSWTGKQHDGSFGLACHLGVVADLPTVGIGKNLHHVDGLNQSRVRQLLEAEENHAKDFITLVGCSGHIWGAAMRSTPGSVKPIFISIGHRISLPTAITIVQLTCKYRVPEPIRQADIRSRDCIRKLQMNARPL